MSRSRITHLGLAAVFAAISTAGAADAATIYNAVNDFSGSNPSGAWTYAYHDIAGVYQALDLYHTPFSGLDAWQNTDGSCCGTGTNNNSVAIGKNVSGVTLSYETISLPTNYLVMDPESNKSVDLIFTAPTSGFYRVAYDFDGVDTQAGNYGAGHETDVLVSGVLYPPSAFGYIGGFGDSVGGTFKTYLSAGQTVDFQTLTSPSTYAYLSTGIQAEISMSPVPLPASAPMFGAALAGLGAFGYRLKRRTASTAA